MIIFGLILLCLGGFVAYDNYQSYKAADATKRDGLELGLNTMFLIAVAFDVLCRALT